MIELIESDSACLAFAEAFETLDAIGDGFVDMVLCDLPYGTTRNAWDSVLDLDRLWAELYRVAKPNAAIVLFAQTPFDKVLGCSNLEALRYEWIWKKERGTGHLNAKRAPMKDHENVLVFYREPPIYNPQMRPGKPYSVTKGGNGSNYGGDGEGFGRGLRTTSEGERYPLSVLEFPRDRPRVHPTQKPVDLCRYLIRTYTEPGAVVLDPTCGSGTTGVAAALEGRAFIIGDSDPVHVSTAFERLQPLVPGAVLRQLAA